MKKHYYFAYGMNTNINEMRNRCPNALDLGKAHLLNYKMVFKYFCDVIEKPGTDAPGVLWKITDQCLASLDILEGYPTHYERKYAPVQYGDSIVNALVYYMVNNTQEEVPGTYYYNMVRDGYSSHNISEKHLIESLPFQELAR